MLRRTRRTTDTRYIYYGCVIERWFTLYRTNAAYIFGGPKTRGEIINGSRNARARVRNYDDSTTICQRLKSERYTRDFIIIIRRGRCDDLHVRFVPIRNSSVVVFFSKKGRANVVGRQLRCAN